MSLQACANLVHEADPARWRAAMSAPPAARDYLLPIYAANVEISRAPWVTKEPMIAHMRLQWWRDVMAELKSGQARRHEVVDALTGLDTGVFDHLTTTIDARAWDIEQDPFATPEDVRDYSTAAQGPMMAGFVALGGASSDLPLVKDLAAALGISRFLQAFVDLQNAIVKGTFQNMDPTFISTLATLGHEHFRNGSPLLRKTSPATSALIEAAGAQRFLKFSMAHPNSVLDGAIPGYTLGSSISRARVSWGIKPPVPRVLGG